MIIQDVIKFVHNFAGVIDKSTPHLYLSALTFSPSKSVVARCLGQRFLGIAQVVVRQHDGWPRNEHVLQGHTDSVMSVAFSPDARHIVSGSSDKTIQFWNAQTGVQVGNTLEGHTDSVYSVAFSPDGRYIVSGSDDKTIKVWDAQVGVAGLWAPIKSCCCGYLSPTTQYLCLLHRPILSSLEVSLSLI